MSIIVKSGVPGKVPTASQLEYGQLALNYADQKIYFKNSVNQLTRIPAISINGSGYNIDAGSAKFRPWSLNYATIQFGNAQLYSGLAPDGVGMAFNCYYDGVWRYLHTGAPAGIITLNTTSYYVRYAAAGTADAPITFTSPIFMNSSGIVTHSLVPAFQASTTGGATPGSDVIFNIVQRNNGNHYNPANGRFTAPVDGHYQFNFNLMVQYTNPAGEYRFAIYVNGVGNGGHRFIYQKPASGFWYTMSGSGLIYLTAGQYVTLRFESGQAGSAVYTDANYSSFSGALIG